MHVRSVVWLAGFAGLLLLAVSVRAEADELASYQAVYDLAVDDSGGGDSTATVGGRMAVEFTGAACKGYKSQMRIVTEGEDSDGNSQITDARTDSLETTGGRYEFTTETYVNDALAEQAEGAARRNGSGVTVILTKPGKKSLTLGNVVFPTEQMKRVLAAAAAGQHFVTMDIFDGSQNGEVVFATAAVIGKESTAGDDYGDETLIGEAGFAGQPHWPVTVSYFEKGGGKTDDTPTYVTSFVLYANGIGRSLRIDYGKFALNGHLSHLEMLPAPKC